MAWLRIDDRFRTHPKTQKAGLGGWLAFCGMSYAREHLTDGVIPREVVGMLAPGISPSQAMKLSGKLVEVGLWHEHPEGFLVHDYHDWNPTREDALSKRDKWRDTKRKQRGQDEDVSHASASVPARDRAGDAGSPSPSSSRVSGSASDLSTSVSTDGEVTNHGGSYRPVNPAEATAITHTRASRSSGRSLMAGHLGCYFAPEACGRGVCVPSWLGREWLQQFADPSHGEREIASFVRDVLARLPDGPVGDEPKVFWRAQWKARHGSVVGKPGSRTGDTVDAAKEFLRERHGAVIAAGGD